MTHRVVDVTPAGDYVTRGDANGHIDSTPVPPDTIQGVGRILVPAIATPFVWANNSQWTHLIAAAVAVLAALWASRWALLARHNPWSHRPPPPVDNSITTIGALLGIWPTPQPATTAVAQTTNPAPPPTPTRTGRRGPQRLAVTALAVAAVASAAVVAPNLIQSQAAFTNAPDNTANSWIADTLTAPTSLNSTTNGNDIDLDWTATIDTWATGHRIYRSSSAGGPYSQIAEITPRTTVTHTDSPADGTYYYIARAYYLNWESPNSNETSATVADPEDYDAIVAASDNCPTTFNIDQYDTDTDGTGDACDPSPTVASGALFSSGQSLSPDVNGVDFADLDGDGDLDIAYARSGSKRVMFNDGTATFGSPQFFGSNDSWDVALGDLDGDGDIDAAFANYDDPNTVWLNDGTGTFSDSGRGVALADVEGDGDLDMIFANSFSQPNTVWLNDGTGTFTDSGQTLGSTSSRGLALGDLDGDGDIDATFANGTPSSSRPNRVWLNDGTGTFTDSGQTLGSAISYGVALADFDGDGDLDAVYSNSDEISRVWLNDGTATFTDSGENLGTADSLGVAVGDLDGDGDIDVMMANDVGQGNRVWFNDGTAAFTVGSSIGALDSHAVALGDLDGDGDLDAAFGNWFGDSLQIRINS